VSPPAQLAAASRAGQLACGQVRLGPLQVHDPDHRGVVSAQRTSVVYHGPVRQRSTGVGPNQQPNPSTVEAVVGLRVDTVPMSRLAGAGRSRRVATVAAPTSAPGTCPTSSPSTARITLYIVVLTGG
jgi:hypothetical protein